MAVAVPAGSDLADVALLALIDELDLPDAQALVVSNDGMGSTFSILFDSAARPPLRHERPSGSIRIAEEFAYGATHTLRCEPTHGGPSIEAELASRPYEVLGVATQKRWLLEMPSADLHVMPKERAPDA